MNYHREERPKQPKAPSIFLVEAYQQICDMAKLRMKVENIYARRCRDCPTSPGGAH